MLLSAVAVAAATSKFPLPCFLPVHDGLRDAYWGIAPAGTATRHFETDSVHLSSPPPSLLQARTVHPATDALRFSRRPL